MFPGTFPARFRSGWADSSVVGLDRDIILVAEDGQEEEARKRLSRVGIDRVEGYLADGIAGWAAAGLPLAQTRQIEVQDLNADRKIRILDVRRQGEWRAGHIDRAALTPLDDLKSHLDSLDRAAPLAVHCKSGYRSLIASSLLEANGFANVMNVLGGFDAWAGAGLPVRKAETA